jgi:integrase
VRYIREAEAEGKRSLCNDRHALRWLDVHLGELYLDQIDRAKVDQIVAARQRTYVKVYKSGQQRQCKPGVDTVNRFLTTFRSLLYKARDEWEWVERVPKVKALKGSRSRMRWISRTEADRLVAALPKHLAAMAEFTLQTGLRRANVTHLEWSRVDLERRTAWVLGEETKNGKALAVPLTDKAVQILEEWRGKHPRWVFPKAGKPVHQTATRAWKNALQEIAVENFAWHGLRHTWASWHVQRGTPLHVLQELGGWSSIKMVQRYAHLSGEHLRAWIEPPKLQLVVNNEGIQPPVADSRHISGTLQVMKPPGGGAAALEVSDSA